MQTNLIEELKRTNRQFINLFFSFSDAQINSVPFKDSWTPAQVAEHVIKSETGMYQSLKTPGKKVDRKPDARVAELKDVFLNFSTKLKSPDFILPEKKEYNKDELIETFNEISSGLATLAGNVATAEAIVNPALGEMTKEEMIYFIIYHTQRHTHQLQTIFKTINNTIMTATHEEIIRKVNEAFNNNDMPAFLSYCTDDIRWNMIGSSSTQGKEAILKMMNGMPDATLDITIDDIFIQNDKAACSGTFFMTKPTGEKEHYSFCDIYQFDNGKIAVMNSYVLTFKDNPTL